MAWNRAGTISVANGSLIVNGAGTSWITGAKSGEALKAPDGQLYEIANINSDAQMTLATPYLGATAAGQTYVIVPTQSYMRDLANQAAALINQFADVVNGVGAGKFATGISTAPSVRGVGDLDTGVNFAGGDVMQLVTGGLTRLRLGDDGTTQVQAQNGLGAWTDRSATGASQASLIVREKNAQGVQANVATAAPRLSLYWSGVFAGQISCDTQGLKLLDDPGTGYAPFRSGTHGIIGQLSISSGANQWFGIGAGSIAASSGAFYKGGTTTVIGYLGSDGGALISAGSGNNFVLRAEGELLLNSQAGTVRPTGNGDTRLGYPGYMWSEVYAGNAIFGGVLSAGYTSGGTFHRIGMVANEGSAILEVSRSGYGGMAVFGTSYGYVNNTATCVSLGTNSTTGRSLNAGGTINASGSDYAEYHRRCARMLQSNILVLKGQIIGLDADDEITDRWSEAFSFGIKSTAPSYVGGDNWASHLTPPTEPIFEEPTMAELPQPVEREFVEQAEPHVSAEPETLQENAGPRERAAYEIALEAHMRSLSERAAAVAEARTAFDAETRALREKQIADHKAAHQVQVKAAKAAFDAGPWAQYAAARATFDAELEAARLQVDRIAYSGRVPVSVTGAQLGDYIVAAEGPNDTIVGQVVTAGAMRADMGQYVAVVGRVRAILPDGRATCAVVVH